MKLLTSIFNTALVVLILTTVLMLGAEPPLTEETVDTYDGTMFTLGKIWVTSLLTMITTVALVKIINNKLNSLK